MVRIKKLFRRLAVFVGAFSSTMPAATFWAARQDWEWAYGGEQLLIRGPECAYYEHRVYTYSNSFSNSLTRSAEELWDHVCIRIFGDMYTAITCNAYRLPRFSLYYLTPAYRRHNKMAMHLYFVTEPDINGVEGEPLLGSAGKDPEDAWQMLAANREREMGTKQNVEELKTTLTARGCVVHKYLVRPLQA